MTCKVLVLTLGDMALSTLKTNKHASCHSRSAEFAIGPKPLEFCAEKYSFVYLWNGPRRKLTIIGLSYFHPLPLPFQIDIYLRCFLFLTFEENSQISPFKFQNGLHTSRKKTIIRESIIGNLNIVM